MTLRLYNTMSRRVEEVKQPDDMLKMYVCGITPYDHSHVGHAMSYIIFDVLRRFLEYRGFKVKHVQNYTDIDDRIIARAAERGITYDELAATDGNNHAVHYNRGVVLLESGRHEEAAAAFMEAAARGLVKLKPDLSLGRGPSGFGLLGLAGVGARLLGRAISSPPGSGFPDWLEDVELRLQSLLDRFGPRSDLLHSLASLARLKGDSAAAVERYHAILALHPDDEVARFQLEYLAVAGD